MSAPFDTARVAAWAEELEGRTPEEILAAVAPHFPGSIALATSFGPEDNLLLDVIGRHHLPIGVFTLDTGFLFAETQVLWARLEERYEMRIRAVSAGLPACFDGRPPQWQADPHGCCQARKVQPLRRALSELGAWVTGIRREQTPDRAGAKVVEWDARFGLVKVNPLVAWRSDEVWARLRRLDVPYNPLHDQGYASIGCAPCTTPVKAGEDPRSGRWRGREKTECGLHLAGAQAGPGGRGSP